MRDNSALSIIVPCYNCEDTIISALNSIDCDAESFIEIICVNDCSTDNTPTIISEYAKKNNNVLFCSNDRNLGAAATRNKGISMSSGDYLVFLDSDDEFVKGSINKMLNMIKSNKDIYIFNALFNSRKKVRSLFCKNNKSGDLPVGYSFVYTKGSSWGKIYRRKLVCSNNIFFGNLIINEDLVFTKECISKAKSIYYFNDYLYKYKYKTNKKSLMHLHSKNNIAFEQQAFDIIKSFVDNKRFLKELNSLYFIEVLYSRSKRNFLMKTKYKNAREEFLAMQTIYDKKDCYYKKYNFRYKAIYTFFKLIYKQL